MSLRLDNLIESELRIRNSVVTCYKDPSGESDPITDGVVNPELYSTSSPRILWILKEPYCDGKKRKGGGWSLSGLLNDDTDSMSRQRAYQPICYINYGISKNVHDWDAMPWLKDCDEMRMSLRKIAYINVSKLPGLTNSYNPTIAKAYQDNRTLILSQIDAYAPNIIFACAPHAQLILNDLGFEASQLKWFGSAASAQISSRQKLVIVMHPSSRTNRRTYVNDAIKAAIS
jgi:hypothetical protein